MGERYEASGIANWFGNGNQVTILAGGNNINDMGFGDMGRGRFNAFGSDNGGVLTSQRFGVNFNVGKDEKIRVGGNIFYSHTDRDSRSRSETQYLFPDYTNFNSAQTYSRDKGHSLRADLRLQWNINDNNTFEFRPRFSVDFRNSKSTESSTLRQDNSIGTLINSNQNSKANKGTAWNAGGELIYNHNFTAKKGRSFSVMAQYQFSDTHQKGITWSDIEYMLQQENSETLFRFLDSRQWSNNVSGRFSWTEPLGDVTKGNFLDISYRVSYKFNNADKLTYNLLGTYLADEISYPNLPDIDNAPSGSEYDPILSNRFRNNYFSQEVQVGYKKVSKKLNLNAGIVLAPASSSSKDLINSNRNIKTRWVWNVGPYARIRYKFNDQTSINIRYRSHTTQPSLTALQPVEDVSDPMNIIKGNPELKPTFTQNIHMMYNTYSTVRSQSIMAMLHASYSINSVVQKTQYNANTGVRTTTYTNANGDLSMFGMGMYSRVLSNNHFSVNARLGVSYTSSTGYIDGDYNRTNNLNLSPTAGISYTHDIVQVTLNPTYSYGLVTNSLARQPNRNIHSYGFDTDVTLTLPFGLQASTDLSFSNSSGYSQGYNDASWLWNAKLQYSFLKDHQLTVFVKTYDMLGLNKNITRTTSSSIITDREINDLTRYVMFGITWNFSTLKKGKKIDDLDFGPMGPPPGERGTRSMHGGGRGEGRPPIGPPM